MSRFTTILPAILLVSSFTLNAQSINEESLLTDEEQPIESEDLLDGKNQIECYPNPAVDFLNVQISNTDLHDVQFEIRSLLGAKMPINVQDMGGGLYRFPVDDFSQGYYFIIIKDETKRFKKAFRFLKSG